MPSRNGPEAVLFYCLQEVQAKPVLNALKDPRKAKKVRALPSAHLPIRAPQDFKKSELIYRAGIKEIQYHNGQFYSEVGAVKKERHAPNHLCR